MLRVLALNTAGRILVMTDADGVSMVHQHHPARPRGSFKSAPTVHLVYGLGALRAVYSVGVILMALKPCGSKVVKGGALSDGVGSILGLGPGVGGDDASRTDLTLCAAKKASSSSAAEKRASAEY